jgi:hypothetical protein
MSNKNGFNRWPLGDSETGLPVSANSSLTGAPIHLSRANIDTAVVTLARPSGSGTVSLSAEISIDGVNGKVSLGEIITDVTDTPKSVALKDLSAPYGNFLTLTANETGGASATVISTFMAQAV